MFERNSPAIALRRIAATMLNAAIEKHRDYIAGETLVGKWSPAPLREGAFHAEVKVDGQPLVIELRKIGQ